MNCTETKRDIKVMGILNTTPDSFYSPSRANLKILESEADIIDVGAISTRPGATSVSEEEEWSRLSPVMTALRDCGKQISIDTERSGIVKKVLKALGKPFIVNDISAGEEDSEMLRTVAAEGLGFVAMHKRGNPQTMQSLCDYGNVTTELIHYFEDFAEKAARVGVKDWILDPGFGFAKTDEQNVQLLRELGQFCRFDKKILVGISRKSFLCRIGGCDTEHCGEITQEYHLKALENGADILRVHDVAETIETIRKYHTL